MVYRGLQSKIRNGGGRISEGFSHREPTLDAAQTGLARAYESLNRLQEAEQSYKAVIALAAGLLGGIQPAGHVLLEYLKAGGSGADVHPRDITSLTNRLPRVTQNLGITRIQQDRYAEAIEPLERSLKTRKTGAAHVQPCYGVFSQPLAIATRMQHACWKKPPPLETQNYEIWGNPRMRITGRRCLTARQVLHGRALELGEETLKINPSNLGRGGVTWRDVSV